MRHNQCKFCTSRNCNHAIASEDGKYNEVSCSKHYNMLYDDACEKLPIGMKRVLTESTGGCSRRENSYAEFIEQCKKRKINTELYTSLPQ